MKKRSPIHFVARLFKPIAPCAQGMERKSERCGIFGKPHAAPVQRFDMHAPERAKSDWTAVCAHTVTVARRPPRAHRRRHLRRVPTQFLQMFRTFTEILRAHQMADPLLERRDRKLAPAAIFRRLLMTSVPGLNVLLPVRTVCFSHERVPIGVPPRLRRNPICSRHASAKESAGTGRLLAGSVDGKIKVPPADARMWLVGLKIFDIQLTQPAGVAAQNVNAFNASSAISGIGGDAVSHNDAGR